MQFSLLMYRLINVYFRRLVLSKWITKKTWKMHVMQRWWHSFMNQRLNHLVLLYRKCNCIRIMSLNTYNKNVDIIWDYCIISLIKLHDFWKRSALTNMKRNALKYMINRFMIWHFSYHMSYQPSTHISPRACLGLMWHVIWKMPYNNL